MDIDQELKGRAGAYDSGSDTIAPNSVLILAEARLLVAADRPGT
jgi:hypothetical protein